MTQKERKRLRFETERNLIKKYQLLFLNEFKFNGLEYGVADFFMKKLLFNGEIAAFRLDAFVEEAQTLAFGTYTAIGNRDWKGSPIKVRILNEWNNALIPKRQLTNNEDVVLLDLGFKPQDFIDEYVVRLLDIQSTIDANLNAQKTPFILKSTDKKTINAIEKILDDAELIYAESELIDVLDLKVDYIIDKLVLYKRDIESELLSVLGIDNVKFEKKAQMTKDEINANNDEIDAYRKVIRDRIEEFFAQVDDVLGITITVEKDKDEMYEEGDEDDEF